ncbi:peptidylprolyl isomerase [Aquicoccus sp. G2-2]|uniref:peptidylprolyl isomerase n=1 Tax=Aquicoccus sp. G2-2 TaxID=3092120 RepID=UPI002ADFDBF5|nr:peptidylprolyl isomerase [Aquicoccus sp. G2-2]MEA1112320.1 peptidylprolyl isomerase [Aquicoccus sp. G2-2]
MTTILQPDVTVNGHVIAPSLIAAEAQNHAAPKGKPGWAWRAAARAMVVRHLLLEEARKLALDPAPIELTPGKLETDEESQVRLVIEHYVRPIPPDEKTCRAFHARHRDRYRSPSLYEAAHILLPAAPNDTEARTKARDIATQLIAQIKASPRDFDQLAAENSACESRANGGRMGQISSGDTVPEFETALDQIAPESLCERPVETRYGVHVVRLDARSDGVPLPFEAVHDQIHEHLEQNAWAVAAKGLVKRLMEQSKITGLH